MKVHSLWSEGVGSVGGGAESVGRGHVNVEWGQKVFRGVQSVGGGCG